MAFIGIDFGKKRVGIALSESGLQAEPLQVIHYEDKQALFDQLAKIVTTNEVTQLVVGVPPKDVIGARDFGEQLAGMLQLPVAFVGEDLTSWQAHQLQKKTRVTDDLAATLILQEYLDTQ